MLDYHLYSPDGSSVLLDGVVGGATGISTPGENIKLTFIIDHFISACLSLCARMLGLWPNVLI